MPALPRLTIWRVIAGLLGAAVLAFGLVVLIAQRQMAGHWPFHPLERREHNIWITGGGVVTVFGVEDRGWLGDAFVWNASYVDPAQGHTQPFAHWVGDDGEVVAVRDGDALVCLTPDRQRLYVRTRHGAWRTFDLMVPASMTADEADRPDRLPARDLRRVLDAIEYGTVASGIRSYDPARHELVVELSGSAAHDMIVRLDPSALTLTLVEVRPRS